MEFWSFLGDKNQDHQREWKNMLKKTPACIIRELAMGISKNLENDSAPLHVAARIGDPEIFQLLMENSLKKYPLNSCGWTPFHLAAMYGQIRICEILSNYKINKIFENNYGQMTPPHKKARERLENGVDKNPKDTMGFTPLHFAAYFDHPKTCKWLLENKVDKNARTNCGSTALHCAVMRGFLEICKILLEYKIDINSRDRIGLTPLHIAARDGYLDVCKYLIGFGADKTLLCNNGKTPLKLAAEKQHFKVVLFLLENSPEEKWIQEKMMKVILEM